MNPGEVVGAIRKDRKPRRRLTLKDRLVALDAKIARAKTLHTRLLEQRSLMVRVAQEEAKAALAEAEAVK